MNMNEHDTPVSTFVTAEEAAKQIEEAVLKIEVEGIRIQDVFAEVLHESAVDWTINVTFRCLPADSPLAGEQNDAPEMGFQVTGNARHSGDDLVVIDSEGSGDKGPVYVIWTVLHCEHLWTGPSFPDCLETIASMK